DNEQEKKKKSEALDTPELVDNILGAAAVHGAAATTPLPALRPRPPPSER
ncbi:uncharacterized protein DAT39_002832, partial [Clarias magur]